MTEFHELSALEASAKIKSGDLTAEALMRSCFERIDERDELVENLDKVRGKVLNIGTDSMMLSLVGTPSLIDDFESFLSNFGIVELQRTGRVALDAL